MGSVFMERESLADGLTVQLLVNLNEKAGSDLTLRVVDPLGEVEVPITYDPDAPLESLLTIFDHPYSTALIGRNPWQRSSSAITDADAEDEDAPTLDPRDLLAT